MSRQRPDGRLCPICGKPVEARFRPFCSPRCKDVDLGRWLKGAYAIPAALPLEDDEEEAPGKTRDQGEDT